MIRRLGNVLFVMALLVFGAMVVNVLNAASPAASWDAFVSMLVVGTIIGVTRYILLGRI